MKQYFHLFLSQNRVTTVPLLFLPLSLKDLSFSSGKCHSNQCVDSQFSWHHSLRISFGSVIRNILCHGLRGNCISYENCFEIKQNFEKLMITATESVKSMISSSQHPGKGINKGKNSYFSTI